jgi:hypothetical protein
MHDLGALAYITATDNAPGLNIPAPLPPKKQKKKKTQKNLRVIADDFPNVPRSAESMVIVLAFGSEDYPSPQIEHLQKDKNQSRRYVLAQFDYFRSQNCVHNAIYMYLTVCV